MPHRQGFVSAIVLSVVHYLCIIATATSLITFFIQPTHLATRVFAASLICTAVTWLIAFLKRRNTHCPLCKGTPLINSGALTHQKAFRLYPFNHGVTATLSLIASQKFRCMYCGTNFDILKTPSHLRNDGDSKYAGEYAYTTYTSDEPSQDNRG